MKTEGMQKTVYIAIDPATRMVNMACSVEPKDAIAVASAIKSGMIIERVRYEDAKNMFMNKVPDNIEL